MKQKLKIFIPCLLTLLFLTAGIGLMTHCIRTTNYWSNAISEAHAALADSDTTVAEEAESTLEKLYAENDALRNEISELEAENTKAQETLTELLSAYEALRTDDNTFYYMEIMKSLKEGMVQVENAIENAQ